MRRHPVNLSDAWLRRDEAMDKTTSVLRLLHTLLTLSSVAGLWLTRLITCALVVLSTGKVVAAAEPADRVVHVGYLSTGPMNPRVSSGRIGDELAKLGYVEGRNLVIDVRHSGGDPQGLDAAAAELVKLKVDVIFAVTIPAAFAAQRATRDIPIVAWGAHGAVESGLVSNLRRPGGNLTGTETLAPEIDAKRLQLFKQLVPALDRISVVTDKIDQGVPQHLKYIGAAGQQLGVKVVAQLEVGRPVDFPAVLAAAAAAGKPLGAIFMLTTLLTFPVRQAIVDFALGQRLPSMCEFKLLAQAGCLMSYGPTFDEITQRSAAQIDKIVRGTPPGELPMEQPTRFELVINLKTAKALGLTVPRELLLRADEVIE
jgi:putative ABC transport system substrate-binding protein